MSNMKRWSGKLFSATPSIKKPIGFRAFKNVKCPCCGSTEVYGMGKYDRFCFMCDWQWSSQSFKNHHNNE